ncbi:MAG: FHA domain-containing protein [Lachnospiraceae bacterium]|nr:FHA domain-containing protein [Lachnospiraceae bacterium]
MQMEYVRNLHSNYLRLELSEKPQERRYQYCILGRGGIDGLLNCELRYLDEKAFLYYDITSRHNLEQLYAGRLINRQWVLDFFQAMRRLQRELERFLLEEKGCVWNAEYLFQDLERNKFYCVYIPYYEGKSEFDKLLTFMIEHLDYEDDKLVECIYRISDRYRDLGIAYLEGQIFKDVEELIHVEVSGVITRGTENEPEMALTSTVNPPETYGSTYRKTVEEEQAVRDKGTRFSFWEGRRKREKNTRISYRESMQQQIKGMRVAEEADYMAELPFQEQQECGNTIYMEEIPDRNRFHRLYTPNGDVDVVLPRKDVLIGKKESKVDIVISESSVSRLHAKLIYDGEYYLEDMNSTNGTFINGLRLLPYEKRLLEPGDEVCLGKCLLIFR